MKKRKKRKETIEKRKASKKALNARKNKLLDKWKKEWSHEEWNENLDTFFRLFLDVYEYTIYLNEDNKNKNFIWKRLFVKLLIIGFIVYLIFFVYNFCKGDDKFTALIENGLIMFWVIFSGGIISKWIDIKKYQETWVRHSWHLHMMETEMLRFISNIDPYNNLDRKTIFVERILAIWDQNEEKFVHNMENKEKELMDVFSKLEK